jgi:DNA-binding IclR family transcriptional regulator
MTKNMVHRALENLVAERLVLRHADSRRYELGYGVIRLKAHALDEPDIATICAPFMDRMEAISGLSISLQVPVGSHQLRMHGVDGRRSGLTRVVKGVPVPLHVGSGSRAILAFMSDKEIDGYIESNRPLSAATEHTIVDPSSLRNDIRMIRKEGFARSLQDQYLGVRGVAFPILSASNRPLGSVAIVGVESTITQSELDQLIPRFQEIMQELNSVVRMHLGEKGLG